MTLSSCLITQPVHFDEPANSPPAISDLPTAGVSPPLSEIVFLPAALMSTGDAGVATSLTLGVQVYDPDVDQALSWRAFVDSNVCCGGDVPRSTATTGRERRALTFPVPTGTLDLTTTACHRIDLYVTGAFDGNPLSHTPREANDIASATWWVAVQPPTMSSPAMSDCPTRRP